MSDDVQRIIGLGFSENFFTAEFKGFKKLRNSQDRCVFHDGKQCTIYTNRPSGCRLYPVIFDENSSHPVLDNLCPFRAEFALSYRDRRRSAELYLRLMDERKASVDEKKRLRTLRNGSMTTDA